MKRILTSALAIVLFIGAANAQTDGKQKNRDKNGGYEMALKGADLSEDQKNKLKKINEAYRIQVADLKAQNLSAEQMKEKRQALHHQHTADIQVVLTAEQKTRLLPERKERKERKGKDGAMKANKNGRGKKAAFEKDNRGEKAQERAADLDLSADQQAKIKTIRETYKIKSDAVRNDATLSKEVKREKMKEVMKAQQQEMKAVLTSEQQSKMKMQ